MYLELHNWINKRKVLVKGVSPPVLLLVSAALVVVPSAAPVTLLSAALVVVPSAAPVTLLSAALVSGLTGFPRACPAYRGSKGAEPLKIEFFI